MAQKIKWNEAAGVMAVILILLGLPLLLWYWRHDALVHRYPPGTKIINLTAIANGGIWTQQEIAGWNYWWREPAQTGDIPLNQGDRVVVRLHSVDVLHSFAIPLLHLGPVDVPAGHTVEVKFDAEMEKTEAVEPTSDVLMFLCWQWCSPHHPKLRGQFVVGGGGTEK